MQHDLHMSDTEWSAGISMFYVGYIISQVPANVILAKGNPHFVCDARVLVKPYKEKGKVPDRFRHSGGLSPHHREFAAAGLVDSRDPFDLQQPQIGELSNRPR